ncbi:MAG: hypothetical protein Kow0029_13090 [Candidatus Rifleibacteriota bacterium]
MAKFRFCVLVALLLLFKLSPLEASDYAMDGTPYFKQEVEWLEDHYPKETKAEALLRLNGFVAYSDRKSPEVGDVETFTTCNFQKNAPERIRATLRKIGKHCYVYVENGKNVDSKAIDRIVSHFDGKIVPEVHSMFGSEWSPGIDGDKRITLLLLDIKDSYDPGRGRKGFTAGYFNASDEFDRSKNPKSNEREMLYLDIYPGQAGSDKFMSVLAHEFQHMVHWNNDPKEYDWVDESLAQLASFLCGYGHPPQVFAFIRNPDNNMCAWSKENMLANYGQVYLWAYYIATHIASTDDRRRSFVRKMVEQRSQGMSGLNAAIKKQGIKNNVKNLFKSFCLANYLNDSSIARGAYGYDKWLAKLKIKPQLRVSGSSISGKANVKCWSAKAIEIDSPSFIGKNVGISFSGQKIQAGKYSNSFDVAFVSYSSSKKARPSVTWLPVRVFKASKVVKVPENHDKMFLLVVNQGPIVMKIEQAYAQGAKPAAFSFALSIGQNTTVARNPRNNSSRSSSRRRVSRSRARSMLEAIVAATDFDDTNADILAQKDTAEQNAAEVSLDLQFQRLSENEDLLIEAIREEIDENNYTILKDFKEFYKSSDDEGKRKLNALRQRILDILRFEEMQGNTNAQSLKAQLAE